MGITTKVKLKKDDRVWKQMAKNLSKGGDKISNIGWVEPTMHPSGVPVAQIAKWNEEGHINGMGSAIPGSYTLPRPYMRLGFLPRAKLLLPSFTSLAHQVAMGSRTWTDVNNQVGVTLKNELQEIIEAWSSPANSPVTVRLKGKNDPLIDTGFMLDTVQNKVTRRGAQQ